MVLVAVKRMFSFLPQLIVFFSFDAFYSAAKHKELEIYCPPMELRTSNNGSIQYVSLLFCVLFNRYIQYIDNNDNINALFSNEFIKCN